MIVPHLPFPLFVIGLVVCALLIGFGLLHDREIDRAEDRARMREFRTELVETVNLDLPEEDGWVPGHGTEHFFGTDVVQYDPGAHAAEIIENMTADTENFMAHLRALA
jgi:hypothetical protein